MSNSTGQARIFRFHKVGRLPKDTTVQRESVIKVQDGVHVVVCKACVVKLAFLVAGHYHHLFFVFCQNPTQLVY